MEYTKYERHIPVCLECGDKIRYGRTDKKFCCEVCKNNYYNALARSGRTFRRRVLAILSKNYSVLDGLVRSGVESMDLMDLMSMGFSPSFCTSCRRNGKHDEFRCFDIKYIMTRTRIFSISKIQNFD